MKKLIFAAILTCLALNARAQTQQQIDSTPPPSLWVRANLTSAYGDVGVNYLSPDTCWGGSSLGRMISTDGGMNWTLIQRYLPTGIVMYTPHDGYGFAPPPSGGWIYKTTSAWVTWDSVPFPPMNGFNSACIADSLHAFICGGNDIGRTTDGGQTWTKTSVPGFVGWIGFANPSVGYAVGGDPSYCFKTSDGGNTWNKINTGLVEGTPDSEVTGIAIIDPHTAIISRATTIYRTTDDGNHWKLSVGPPLNPQTQGFAGIGMHGSVGYVVGGPELILRTSDSGQTWVQEPSGLSGNIYLSNPHIYDDSLATTDDGNGILLIRKSTLSDVQQPQRDSLTISEFPNPAQNEITIQYTLPQTQHVTVLLYDQTARLVTTILSGISQSSGLQTVQLSTIGLANGAYFFQFSSESYTSTGSFTIQQ